MPEGKNRGMVPGMKLYLLRHGIAVDAGAPGCASDADRYLTDEGREKVRRVAKAMVALELELGVMLSSPLIRARETAEIVADVLRMRKRLRLTDQLAPDASPLQLIREINTLRPRPDAVLLVGHEPFLSEFASFLLTGGVGLALTLRKGGLLKLEMAKLEPDRRATLEWLLTPKQMGLMQ